MSYRVAVVGAGIGGLTAAALLAKAGCAVTVYEGQSYAGGCASTFEHGGYRFESGATVAGGFQPGGPHALVADMLGLSWPVRTDEPAWVVHLPEKTIALTRDNADVLRNFPHSEHFWRGQSSLADLGWRMAAQGLPWPPTDAAEWTKLIGVGLRNLPSLLPAAPYAFLSVRDWLRRHGLANDAAFVRFIDAQLLISAQTTSPHVYALWGATALDLARQGVYHAHGGIGAIADTLVDKVRDLGGEVLFKHHVESIATEAGRATGVHIKRHRRAKSTEFVPHDFVLANLTPWSLDKLLGEGSPSALRREVRGRKAGWGAFVLHLGIDTAALPSDFPDHHQVITDMTGPLGEGRSLFMSLSPVWDATRAPEGQRAATVTTHTNIDRWWAELERDEDAYQQRKAVYAEAVLNRLDAAIPGLKAGVRFQMNGSPVTYEFYTGRAGGMVGGFPARSLFSTRGPRTGLPNVRLVGDSIFPGQSTAGVTIGALRVTANVLNSLPTVARQTTTTSVPVGQP